MSTSVDHRLPRSWTIAQIADLAEINPRLGKSDIDDGIEVSFVPMPAVEAGNGRIDVTATRRFSEVKKGYTPFREGDVLFAKITPCMENGKMAVVPALHSGLGFGSTEFHVLRPKDGVSGQFLYYYVSSQKFRFDAEHNMTGAVGQRRVPTTYVAEYPIHLPPSAEQRRIVAKIEELFSELDKGVESLTTAREQLKAYRQSVLNKAVIGELAGSLSFPSRPLSTVVEELGQGWSPRCLNHPSADDEIWAVITTTAIQHGAFREEENKQLPEDLEPRPNLSIRAGDILITRAGPRKRVGVACLVRYCRPRLMLCDKAYRLRADTSQVIPEWLELLLNSPSILQEIEELKTGISDSGVNLTQNRFLALDIPVPTLAEQQAVLKVVDSLVSQIANLETQIETAMQQSDVLRRSVLKRAFSGHLVPQDASDEPASVLLERIRAGQDEGSTKKRRHYKSGGRNAA